MPVFAPSLKLNNGKQMPVLGLGTWMLERNEGKKLIRAAIDAGYRHFDTAILYHCEDVVGEAIREKIAEGAVKREDLFITSKLWCSYAHPGLVEKACKLTLKNLGLDYLDLYLMHWPFAFKAVKNADEPIKAVFHDSPSLMAIQEYFPSDGTGKMIMADHDYLETWKDMELCVKKGLTRSIGVSNFNAQQVDRLVKNSTIKPVTNQVEVHPYFNQKKLIQFCKERNVIVTAYGPLGSSAPPDIPGIPKMLEHPKVLQIAKETNKSPAQVVLRYLVQLGTIVIPKTVTPKRLEENIAIFDFTLSPEQMAEMDTLNCNQRIYTIPGTEHHKFYPFNSPEGTDSDMTVHFYPTFVCISQLKREGKSGGLDLRLSQTSSVPVTHFFCYLEYTKLFRPWHSIRLRQLGQEAYSNGIIIAVKRSPKSTSYLIITSVYNKIPLNNRKGK